MAASRVRRRGSEGGDGAPGQMVEVWAPRVTDRQGLIHGFSIIRCFHSIRTEFKASLR